MISDEALREAAQKFEDALLKSLPEPEDCPARFSPAFERRMERLILRVDHPFRYWLSRAALLLLLLLALAGAIAGTAMLLRGCPAPRPEPSSAPPTVQSSVQPSAAPSAEPSVGPSDQPGPAARLIYRPTWLPEGCEWDHESLYDGEGMIVYRTPEGVQATFLYDAAGGAAEDAAPEGGREVLVDGRPALLFLGETKGELNELFWDEEGGASFWLSAPFPEEDMIRVAESVEAEPAG